MRVILVFVDGLGIGKEDPEVNPMFSSRLPLLSELCGGKLPSSQHKQFNSQRSVLIPVNATLGVPALPQSGTGQAAIFTGVNAAKTFGKHFGPYPPLMLHPIIGEKNIFRRLTDRGKRATFTNAFPKRFFEYTESGTRRLTVTTLAWMMSGFKLLTAEALQENRAISADFTRDKWPELGHPEIEPTTCEEAGEHLWNIARDNDFTLFEYWLTDHAGHSQKKEFAVEVLERLDLFLSGFFRNFDFDDSLFVLVSDHGNIEDLSTKSHSRNPVPCILAGNKSHEASQRIKSLVHITPTILSVLS
ncbi:MAG: metalloenzyme [Ignavibacteriales bacterium]|nr:metalloenzyme [Ignavibacteriales bacterium]